MVTKKDFCFYTSFSIDEIREINNFKNLNLGKNSYMVKLLSLNKYTYGELKSDERIFKKNLKRRESLNKNLDLQASVNRYFLEEIKKNTFENTKLNPFEYLRTLFLFEKKMFYVNNYIPETTYLINTFLTYLNSKNNLGKIEDEFRRSLNDLENISNYEEYYRLNKNTSGLISIFLESEKEYKMLENKFYVNIKDYIFDFYKKNIHNTYNQFLKYFIIFKFEYQKEKVETEFEKILKEHPPLKRESFEYRGKKETLNIIERKTKTKIDLNKTGISYFVDFSEI